MQSAKDIEKAIESLPKADLNEFRAWFAKYDAEIWDTKIEQHTRSGKLERLGEDALSVHLNKDTKEF